MTPPAEPAADEVFAVSFNRRDKTSSRFDLARLERELADPDVFSWIDIQSADIGRLNDVLRRLDMDLVLTSHFDEPEVLPRVVDRPDVLAFYLYEIHDPERHLDTSHGIREMDVARLILVLGEDFVLTYHRRRLDAVEHVKSNCEESFRLHGKTQGFIAFLFLQRCLYDYAHLNLANDNFLDQLEEEVITGNRADVTEALSLAGRNLLTLKKLTTSLAVVLMLLGTKRSAFISDESRSFYQGMQHDAATVRAAIDSSRDLLDGIVGAAHADAAHRTGEIARVLTVVSTIVLPLTLVAGIYGMNFQNVPAFGHPWGFWLTLAAMAGLAVALLGAFWRLGWLGRGSRPR